MDADLAKYFEMTDVERENMEKVMGPVFAKLVRNGRYIAERLEVSEQTGIMMEVYYGVMYRFHTISDLLSNMQPDEEYVADAKEVLKHHKKELEEDDDSWKSDSP